MPIYRNFIGGMHIKTKYSHVSLSAKVWLQEIKERPTLLISPILVFIILTISFEVGVHQGAQVYASAAQAQASSLASTVTSAFSSRFKIATAILNALSVTIKASSEPPSSAMSNWNVLKEHLAIVGSDLYNIYSGSISLMQVVPNFIVDLILPSKPFDATLLGVNILTPIGNGSRTQLLSRTSAALSNYPDITAEGPLTFFYPGWGVNVIQLIYLNKTVNLTSLNLPYNPLRANCSACDEADPSQQLWGLCVVNLDLESLRNGTDPSFQALNPLYNYILWQPGSFSSLLNNSIPRVNIVAVPDNESSLPSSAITISFDVIPGNTWYLDIQLKGGWAPSWELPLLISLPFASLFISFIVLFLKVSQSRHIRLLRSLVPSSDSILGSITHSGSLSANSYSENSKSVKRMDKLLARTPADRILNLIGQLMKGETPVIEEVMDIRRAIEDRSDLYAAPKEMQANMERVLSADVANYVSVLTLSGARPEIKSGYDLKVGVLCDPFDDRRRSSAFSSSSSNNQDGLSPLQSVIEDSPRPSFISLKSPELTKVLEEACMSFSFSFDIGTLRDITNDHALPVLALYMVSVDTDIAKDLKLNLNLFSSFLDKIEQLYNPHPYHNKTHAADVLQMLHTIVKSSLLKCNIVDSSLSQLAYIVAALTHDVDHYGYNNDFLVNSRNPLAMIHNDHSPMESHHCSLTFTTLYQDSYDFTKTWSVADQKLFRSTVINLIMATDMKQHFNIQSKFTSSIRLAGSAGIAAANSLPITEVVDIRQGKGARGGVQARASPRESPESKAVDDSPVIVVTSSVVSSKQQVVPRASRSGTGYVTKSIKVTPAPTPAAPGGSYSPKDDGEKLLCLQIALKIADISSICRPLPVALRSIQGLEEEFFLQGDKEKALGLQVTPLFDREKTGVSKAQQGFIDFIAMPLIRNFVHIFPESYPILEELKRNHSQLH
ncbi:hypothetical protein CEUSTIGMA_g7715.t1 [Chlamydomonas eustigma]|uniref:Phosphodiesterase n=1 Tax=Chlamydomonas eustigma TaxID=1157962 RepID=A0A250XB18_9CHLO|nr:hypothetical protein CEUSTIGMA_g7715.t1 [Chlamydomonas eustigma]|eukprot:GAX80277.1 hypothetical protein CEUSTIGMA_g7715.t1 [Chlamydomonas eustigma]